MYLDNAGLPVIVRFNTVAMREKVIMMLLATLVALFEAVVHNRVQAAIEVTPTIKLQSASISGVTGKIIRYIQ